MIKINSIGKFTKLYLNILNFSGNMFGSSNNNNTAYTMTKATTVFYPTSPKNSAMT